MTFLKPAQPALFQNEPIQKDIVFTPRWLSQAIVKHFDPVGLCLDPCVGDGAFYEYLPAGAEWCEISKGVDFFRYSKQVDWCISNPPYSNLLGWIRHSFKVSKNVAYLVPLHRVSASGKFYEDVFRWGGIKEILYIGTGADAGFPFGHALGVVHYQKDYKGASKYTNFRREVLESKSAS